MASVRGGGGGGVGRSSSSASSSPSSFAGRRDGRSRRLRGPNAIWLRAIVAADCRQRATSFMCWRAWTGATNRVSGQGERSGNDGAGRVAVESVGGNLGEMISAPERTVYLRANHIRRPT